MSLRLLPYTFVCTLRGITVAAACLSVAYGQSPATEVDSQRKAGKNFDVAARQENRVALVIGNAAYNQGHLANPVNDARAMARRLRELGFDVLLRENLKTREIGGVYREFRSKITPGAVALVFYAGHGIQFKGQNYFPAVDADISSEEDVPLQSLNLGTLLDNMEEAKAGVTLVFLDACRDNPFARRFRSASRGLAKVETATGTLIHYATKPGSVASDGEGQNGTYTEALLVQMSEPGVPVELMLKRVSNQVVKKTKGKQEPWVEGSLRGDFYFIFQGTTSVQIQQAPTDPETEAWRMAEKTDTIEAIDDYRKEYPKGKYISAARIRLAALKKADKPSQGVNAGIPAPALPAESQPALVPGTPEVAPAQIAIAAPSTGDNLPQPVSQRMPHDQPNIVDVPKTTSEVSFFLRQGGALWGPFLSYEIFDGGNLVGKLSWHSHFNAPVSPGQHEFSMKSTLTGLILQRKLTMYVNSREHQYVELLVDPYPRLVAKDAIEGEKMMKEILESEQRNTSNREKETWGQQ